MKKLQVNIPDDLHAELKMSALATQMHFGTYVTEALKRHKTKMKRETSLATVNPDVATLIEEFNKRIDDNTTAKTQQMYAKAIIEKYGLEQALKALDVAVAALGVEFAPQVANIKQLLEKWTPLKGFMRKTIIKNQTKVFR